MTAIESRLAAAKAAHQSGDLASARAGYIGVLGSDPNHAETLYLLGALEYQTGNFQAAISHLKMCTSRAPTFVPALDALAASLTATGRTQDAADIYRRLIALDPADQRHSIELGAIHLATGDGSGAVAIFEAAWARDPNSVPAASGLARALRLAHRLPDAAKAYADAVRVAPNDAALRDEYGAVLFDLRRDDEAEAMVRSAIAIDPHAGNPHTNLGRMLVRKSGQALDALRHHDLCLAKLPNYANAHSNRAAALFVLGRIDEAEASCRTAIALKPTLAEAHSNLGNILQRRGDTRAAIKSYSQALAIAPAFADAQLNRALAHLMTGQFAEGWRDFEARWRCRGFRAADRGQGLARLTEHDRPPGPVLAWGEQGIGDEILYGSMAPTLAAQGFDVVLECDPRLVALWRRSAPALTVVGRDQEIGSIVRARQVQRQIPIGSLGALTRRSSSDFAAASRFLRPDQARSDGYRRRLLGRAARVVGLSWMSVPDETGRAKSVALTELLGHLRAPGTVFVNLQYGETSVDIDTARTETSIDVITLPELDLRNDLDGLAALIAACDAVVTVSNVTAHLAGAIGAPTVVLVPSGVGRFWYWQTNSITTPLYPSVRLLRQSADGEWSEALSDTARRLGLMAATGRSTIPD